MKGEPFRIKMVEPIRLLGRAEREARLREAGLNVFLLRSADVYVDLLTDSGTNAMSDRQWAALVTGDEAYAGSRSWHELEEVVRRITGFPFVLPVHQGRGAERVAIPALVRREGQFVLGNAHFDTTRAHIDLAGGRPVDLYIPEAADTATPHPFKGDLDVERLSAFLDEHGADAVAAVILTITSNTVGGQPVSLRNAREVARICRSAGVPLFLDAARFAENAWLVREREEGQAGRSPAAIARDFFDLADGAFVSAKKDGLVNIGGLVLCRDEELYRRLAPRVVAYEGFLTYGGMAGRDLAALAVGLEEALDPAYLAYRVGQVRRLGAWLLEAGVPIQEPVGGHAVFVDAGRLLPHIPPGRYPGAALAAELYLECGVRGVEVGSLLMGRDPETGEERRAPAEFLRLAVPRRVYTDNHLADVAEGLARVARRAAGVRGLRMTYEPPALRHFLARFRWEDAARG